MEWLNARQDKPIMFGKYFVKINEIKHIIDFHDFDFYLGRGEEVLWLQDGQNKNAINQTWKSNIESSSFIRPTEIARQNQIIIRLKEKIDILESYIKKHDESLVIDDIHNEDIFFTKDEVKKFLNKKFNPDFSGLTLKSVKRLFPQLKQAINIPNDLKSEMIDIYTEEGVANIEFKLRRSVTSNKSQKKRRQEEQELENKLNNVKETDPVNHFKETMKYIEIEFEMVRMVSLMYSSLIDKIE